MKALKIIVTLSLILSGSAALANVGQDDCSQMSSGNQLNLNQSTNPSTTAYVQNIVHGTRPAQQIRSGTTSQTTR